jgi:hypothetical protein
MGGALIAYVLLPGGSMFIDKFPIIDPDRAKAAAKRGNMIFVKNGFIYVISSELAERITEGSAFGLKPDEEDALLRQRLIDIAGKIEYLNPKPDAAAPAK